MSERIELSLFDEVESFLEWTSVTDYIEKLHSIRGYCRDGEEFELGTEHFRHLVKTFNRVKQEQQRRGGSYSE